MMSDQTAARIDAIAAEGAAAAPHNRAPALRLAIRTALQQRLAGHLPDDLIDQAARDVVVVLDAHDDRTAQESQR